MGTVLHQVQQTQNSFDGPTVGEGSLDLQLQRHVFAAGWYVGGLVGLFGVELALSKGVGTIADLLAKVPRLGKLVTGVRAAKAALGAATLGVAKWTVVGVKNAVTHMSKKAVTAAVSKIPLGRQTVVVRSLDDLIATADEGVASGGREEAVVGIPQRTVDGSPVGCPERKARAKL